MGRREMMIPRRMPQDLEDHPKIDIRCVMESVFTSASVVAAGAAHRNRRARRRNRWSSAAVPVLVLTFISSVQCLLMSPRRIIRSETHHRNIFLPQLQLPTPCHRIRDSDTKTSTTSLHLFFDKFLHPYGISPSNHTNDNDDNDLDQSSVELLEALLPRLQTKEERLECFQRRLLDEQLRLSKLSKGTGENNDDEGGAHFLADDEEEVLRMADIFQRARLAEQLRLARSMSRTTGHLDDKDDGDELSHDFDKDEAFQRALLEERLKIRQMQQQRQQFVSTSDSIERAMMEYENETKEEHKTLQMTMVQERETEDANEVSDYGEVTSSDIHNSIITRSTTENNNNDGGNSKDLLENKLPVNQTENVPPELLSNKLEKLHQMVATTTSSSNTGSVALSTGASNNNTTFSLQNFLDTTHLPLPPRENASLFSLALAPVAHILTSLFLLGAAAFHAVMAVLDVIWNDNKGQHSTRACLRETSSVCRSSWNYMFPPKGSVVNERAVQRTLRALRTSIVASFYAIQCIFMRAAKHSRHATECMDAGTGSLRYIMYAMRSAKIFWTRAFNSLRKFVQRKSRSDQKQKLAITSEKRGTLQPWKQKLNPLRALSSIKNSATQRLQRQSPLHPVGDRFRTEEMYNKKLRLLNLDRVALERDRQQLQESWRQLELERLKLLSEGVNALAWYSAASEAAMAAAASENEKQQGQKPKEKRHWSFWRKGEEKED